MNLSGLLVAVRDSPSFASTLRALRAEPPPSAFGTRWGLLDAARPAVLAALQREWEGPILVLTAQPERAHFLQAEAGLWSTDPGRSWYLPAPDSLFYDRTPWDGETIRGRVTLLSALASGAYDASRPPMIFGSVWALMTRTAPVAALRAGVCSIVAGQTIRLNELVQHLVAYAYQPVSVVEEAGTFCRRGGIVDVYPSNAAPVRIEWFGDEVESLRTFDPVSQRSLQQMSSVTLFPASEALPCHSGHTAECLPELNRTEDALGTFLLQRDRERLERGEYFRGMEFYLASLYPEPATFLDYLPLGTLLVVDDPLGVAAAAETLESQADDLRIELLEESKAPMDLSAPHVPWRDLQSALAAIRGLSLGYDVQGKADEAPPEEDEAFHSASGYGGRIEALLEDCRHEKAQGQRVVIVSKQAERLSNLFSEAGEPVAPLEDLVELPPAGTITLVAGSLAEGWTLRCSTPTTARRGAACAVGVTLLTDAEVFGWVRAKRRSFTRKRAASPESFFAELNPGDYVVHIEHGIGTYHGLVRREVEGAQREFLEVEYAEGDRLFVPVSQMDRLTRYVGSTERTPTVYRLGSSDWAQARSRAQAAVQDIARELLELYATREVVPGHAYPADSVWQEELEASFPYEETDDQVRALADVKSDMESQRPMDRLVCGDVGYGKTEVALRAAFKAVMGGKQVAVLVPTTVLAQQHMQTFQQRFSAFPVTVHMLSRFCSPREQKETLRLLQEGAVDVVIGTHRLIQKDVQFKDLGLLVVDEEQRFGVRHKEWLKRMRQQIDVLTMTATPIPRTLYMALSGVRDMSTIDTPPEERLPIRTQVAEFDEGLIRRAVLRELNRGGQVYFVHNRVQGIRQIAQRLQKIVPEASIAIGHGQMPEDKLSAVMLEFSAGKYDVLVCTSIIESGLDIPNVNTIIINRADAFGLAQLYQLRGRVGRSAAQAYAYLLYPKHQHLSDVARKRLEAILESSELGAGFRIAMRDLEIRGAGEILGSQQHGHIVAVGFELYTRLLTQAVKELRETRPGAPAPKLEIELPPVIELPIEACLPDDYVPDEELRLKLYQRLAGTTSEEQLDGMRRELEDRFGLLPPAVEDLLFVLRVRLLAGRADVRSVGREENALVLKLGPHALPKAAAVVAPFGQRAWVGRGQLWLALGKEQTSWRVMLLALLLALGQPMDDAQKAGSG